jgi:hypothetical protein
MPNRILEKPDNLIIFKKRIKSLRGHHVTTHRFKARFSRSESKASDIYVTVSVWPERTHPSARTKRREKRFFWFETNIFRFFIEDFLWGKNYSLIYPKDTPRGFDEDLKFAFFCISSLSFYFLII